MGLGGGEVLVAGEEREALGVLLERRAWRPGCRGPDRPCGPRRRARNGEGLDALTDDGSGLRSGLHAALEGQGAAQGVGPLGVLERDGLGVVNDLER